MRRAPTRAGLLALAFAALSAPQAFAAAAVDTNNLGPVDVTMPIILAPMVVDSQLDNYAYIPIVLKPAAPAGKAAPAAPEPAALSSAAVKGVAITDPVAVVEGVEIQIREQGTDDCTLRGPLVDRPLGQPFEDGLLQERLDEGEHPTVADLRRHPSP